MKRHEQHGETATDGLRVSHSQQSDRPGGPGKNSAACLAGWPAAAETAAVQSRRAATAQRGVALVTTLIMLSLVTFMSVAFLALSRRERAAVIVAGEQVQAKMMADIAVARAQTEMVTRMLATTNRWNYDLLVSTNYYAGGGFVSGNTGLTNVNYDKDSNGIALTNEGDRITNIYNLFYDPRPPVYIDTNYNGSGGSLDFRYYLDFNRNRLFDHTGFVNESGDISQPDSTNWAIGDPQWIGVLEKPGYDPNGVAYRHSGNNRFIGRYAYLVLPAGKSLDLNYLHNQSKYLGTNSEGYLRNQGFGSWEINLAAFLRDLHTNLWGYAYATNPVSASTGNGFDAAQHLTSYRYHTNYFSLSNLAQLFSSTGGDVEFQNDRIDGLGNGPLMTGFSLLTSDNDATNAPWFGSPVPHPYFDVQQLLSDTNQAYWLDFSQHFYNSTSTAPAGLLFNTNRYDRYTFYRMLAQLGVDSAPPSPGKIHLNYQNYVTNTPVANYQTNFISWTNAADFFTLVADAVLKRSFNNAIALSDPSRAVIVYSATNSNYRYRGDIHRCLQVAANIYDATQTNIYPTVFRPQFMTNATDVYITGYVTEDTTNFLYTNLWVSLPPPGSGAQPTNIANITNANIYGVPLVIGAKKGYPNFNEYTVETVMQATRKLQLYKNTNVVPNRYFTNQMLILGVTNIIACEAWNSYTSAFPRPFQVFVTNTYSAGMTNELGVNLLNRPAVNNIQRPPTPYATWPANAFFLAATNQPLLTNNVFSSTPPYWLPTAPYQYSPTAGFANPTWFLNITNRLVYGMIDNGHLVDFVSLDNLVTSVDVSQQLLGNGTATESGVALPAPINNLGRLWDTNRVGGSTNINVPTLGVMFQMMISLAEPRVGQAIWTSYSSSGPASPDREIEKFRVFMGRPPSGTLTPAELRAARTTTNMAAPFAPTHKVYHIQRWNANDPLVHYTLDDLVHPVEGMNPATRTISPPTLSYPLFTLANYYIVGAQVLGKPIDQRPFTPYSPWGGKRAPGGNAVSTNAFDYDLALKDPQVRWSDDWDFPTNKFANVGWLGRVHRGTPWQTIYLKALVANPTYWASWTGYTNGTPSDPMVVHPTNDWFLPSMFTTAPNDDAARGLLSVNQTNLAAWSAVLSGILVVSNVTDASVVPAQYTNIDLTIEPASPQLLTIYNAINAGRDNLSAQTPANVFTNVGQLLAIAELSVGQPLGMTNVNDMPTVFSPYLRPSASGVVADVYTDEMIYGLSDVAYERIPQQLLSLLTLEDTPRIVVYSFGQSLKPAERSIVLAPGPTRGLCTNYQITGEVVTRTVLRIENVPQRPRAVVEAYNVLLSE